MLRVTVVCVLAAMSCQSLAQDLKEKFEQALKKISPSVVAVKSVSDTPISGIKEVVVDSGRGGEVYYMSDDAGYLINGSIFDLDKKEDLTEARKSDMRLSVMSELKDNQRINFYPEDMKYHVTVFTDIDCGYCRKLHQDIEQYNALGIGISYLFFPRAGINSPSYDKAVTVWCSDDQRLAMTESKAGQNLPKKQCDNPIKTHYNAGLSAGVSGTPALIMDNGRLMPGYLPPEQLKQRLDMLAASGQ